MLIKLMIYSFEFSLKSDFDFIESHMIVGGEHQAPKRCIYSLLIPIYKVANHFIFIFQPFCFFAKAKGCWNQIMQRAFT